MSEIQAVYALTTDGWSASTIRHWLKTEGLQPIKRAHRLGTEIRYRITPPRRYSRFTTRVLNNGIHLVLGWHR
jgi:hypothetical protein